jgi:hypothetical protein
MLDMRRWLDDMRFQAPRSIRREIAGRFVVRARFNVAEEAIAFAERLAGIAGASFRPKSMVKDNKCGEAACSVRPLLCFSRAI